MRIGRHDLLHGIYIIYAKNMVRRLYKFDSCRKEIVYLIISIFLLQQLFTGGYFKTIYTDEAFGI